MKLSVVTQDVIEKKIYVVRGHKVMLDRDLAELYQTETRRLNEQVRRNSKRFPDDFMFQLNAEECEDLKSQNATSSWGGTRKLPLAFTENGVAMLSSVLKSERAVQINIAIMRAFVRIRQLMEGNKEFAQKLKQLEQKYDQHDYQIQRLFSEIRKCALPAFEDGTTKVKGFVK